MKRITIQPLFKYSILLNTLLSPTKKNGSNYFMSGRYALEYSLLEVTKKYRRGKVDSEDNTIKPRKFAYGGIVIKRKKYATGTGNELSLDNLEGVKNINYSQLGVNIENV